MTWTKLRAAFARLQTDRSAATAIEYAMIAAIICLALISLQYTIGSAIVNFFTETGNGL
jgi:Flp pilus assembly pilin Flp